jgi:hypothetical protein
VEAGNPGGGAAVPAAGRPVDTSNPDRVVGDGTPASCTSAAVVAAVAAGGVITFSCGPAPVTIRMQQTAQVDNRSARVVIDGGGLVTLSGGGERRILYQNTCDAEIGFTTSHCQDQEQPHLVLQDIGLADGNASGSGTEGGGAVFARGGQLTVIGSRFTGNRCHPVGQDLGGAAIRTFDQYQDRAVVVSDSTFEGGSCANGGALSSIGVSWTIRNSVFRDNEATGEGANPARGGTPGGGSGGAIYCDGNQFVLDVAGTVIEDNSAGRAVARSSSSATTAPASCASTARRRCAATPAPGSRPRAAPASSCWTARPDTGRPDRARPRTALRPVRRRGTGARRRRARPGTAPARRPCRRHDRGRGAQRRPRAAPGRGGVRVGVGADAQHRARHQRQPLLHPVGRHRGVPAVARRGRRSAGRPARPAPPARPG